jgi:site-specific DNA-methyltransferase (adenine-specific)
MEINKIYNECCLETMQNMDSNVIDLVVTSPPYDQLRKYHGFKFDFESTAKGLYRVIKDGGIVVWVVNDSVIDGSETCTSFKQALFFKEIGFNLHDTMIYSKKNLVPLNHKRYEQAFEYMFIFVKGKIKTFNPILKKNKSPGTKKRRDYNNICKDSEPKRMKTVQDRITIVKEYGVIGNIWEYMHGYNHTSKDAVSFKHPATFPEKLARDHIISWSNEGDLIYDPFMGSGTVAKMAILNNRNWIGSEISSLYCEIIKERLNEVMKQGRLF